jgi:two-component system OmpR family sensor kinase
MTPIKGRLDLMRRRALREGRADYLHDSEHAVRNLDRLHRLIDDLLDASRLERGLVRLEPRPTDVVAVVRDAVDAFMNEETTIEVVAARQVFAYADPDRLQQAVGNLLANAVRYSPPGSTVRVEVSSYARDLDQWIQVRVIDCGAGIHPALLPRIFDCFSAGQDSSGLGLGLFLVRGIANAHGGIVSVDSVPGQGSTFVLTWPAHAAEDH